MSGKVPRRVGGYRIVCPLGEGGMAAVYLALSHRTAGFSKLMVVKVLHDNWDRDPDGHRMFLDEARIAALLSHPNVVQTYEAGEDGTHLYLAMEYLEGKSLAEITYGEGIKQLDRDLHLRIIADGLLGLHYAHEICDVDGKPLNVIHRDVSPHNLFVTYEGQAKLVDFGIAKMAGSQKTESGVIKGKIGYIAPELVAGNPVDRRVDVFAAGVMIWEALAQRKLVLRTDDETAMLARRLAGGDPPITKVAGADVPDALIEICEKAMASNPENRYATALELHDALDAFLAGKNITSRTIAKMMQERFADDRASQKRKIEERLRREDPASLPTPEGVVQAHAPNTQTMSPPTAGGAEAEPAGASSPSPSSPSALSSASLPPAAPASSHTGTASVSEVRPPPAPSSKRTVMMASIGLLGAAAAFGLVASLGATTPPPAPPAPVVSTAKLSVDVSPRNAVLTIDGSMQSAPFSRGYPRGSTVRIEASAEGFLPSTREVKLEQDIALDLALTVQPASSSTAAAPPAPIAKPVTAPRPATAPAGRPKAKIDESDPYRKK
ncbi:MAG: serine/threonine-protein kinase [Labilithrix sp.]